MKIKISECVQVRGSRVHNLRDINVDVPRNKIVAFTGISGSGKSSLAFGTLYAEAQHRYLDSVSPYARRLIEQIEQPDVDSIEGLPPAVGLHQQRGVASARSSVGSITTISNSVRMLYSRAGDYPENQPIIYADGFSPNTPQGACETCHGIGKVFDVSEHTLVPNPRLTIREGAVAGWPGAWQGKNLVRILLSLDVDVDIPWQELPAETRQWILYTDETPQVSVYRNYNLAETRQALKDAEPASYKGTFISARSHVLNTFKKSQKEKAKQRVAQYVDIAMCPACEGKKLKQAALAVTLCGLDIVEFSNLSLEDATNRLETLVRAASDANQYSHDRSLVIQNIGRDIIARIKPVLNLGLGYLSLTRSSTTLSPGELQRIRLATQIKSKLFGVVYIMDEPSSGLHPSDIQALLNAFDELVDAGNSVFLVEHNPRVIKHADWLVDIGPGAGVNGGNLVYSGPVEGVANENSSVTGKYLFDEGEKVARPYREPDEWLELKNITRNNLSKLDCAFPLGVITTVTGVSGSGKSSLVSQALVELIKKALGVKDKTDNSNLSEAELLEADSENAICGSIVAGSEKIKRMVVVDQSPIGRTPRSNLATYTGLFDHIRKIFASTEYANACGYDAGQFSFNVAKGRCNNCEGVGYVSIELLFMPSVYSPCPVCHGQRYNEDTLAVKWQGLSIADVLELSVDEAYTLFSDEAPVQRALRALKKVGLGYLRLGQPATELSGGEAQRVKLASELRRNERSNTLYVLDEPTTGLHPADIDLLLKHLNALVDSGSTVVMVEHNMRVASASDYIIDIGPGAGDEGGKIVSRGTPHDVVLSKDSKTAPFILC
ncbi:excinuclease ABC subunit UvrA [Salinimonas chungwhensis]|uniref:excinuclease ABC subunit UvrA n=1 Tax=Salinimonas chungwhensis TaxID=265425 RepID=UPI0003656EA8|nr:excinuclease ABC subunit UvrA [Salinimonas chungwhensis]